MKPPAGVALTTVVQSPPLGGGTCSSLTGPVAASLPCFELHPATAMSAAAQARKRIGFIGSFAPIDLGKGYVVGATERRWPDTSGNLRCKRLQASAQLRVGDFAQALADFLGHRTKLRPLGCRCRRHRAAVLEDDPIDRLVTEEAVDPLHD